MPGPLELGMYQTDPAQQQMMLQQQAQQRAMAQEAMKKRAMMMAQQQRQAQAEAQMAQQQGGGQGGVTDQLAQGMTQGIQAAPPQQEAPPMPQQRPPMMGPGEPRPPQMPPIEEQARQASLMEQLGTFGSPANSALMNAGLATMNAGQQGQSTGRSLVAGLGGGIGAYAGGKQIEEEKAQQEKSASRQRRLEELQMLALQQGLQLGQGGGQPQQQQVAGMY